MTKQRTRRNRLIKRGYFMTEVKAWSAFEWKEAPWWPRLRASRSALVKKWAKKTGRSLDLMTPEALRKNGEYQRMVRDWYLKHGWVTERLSAGRKRKEIDPYAAMRWYSDNYARETKNTRDPYKPGWKDRQVSRRKRERAIDERFSTSPGLVTA